MNLLPDRLSLRMQKLLPLMLILMFTVISYGNIFTNTLVWDDHDLIENWEDIRSYKNISVFLTHATNPNYPDTYRPIRYVFSIVLYHLFGTNPLGYHIVTLAIHGLVTWGIYTLLSRLTRDSRVPFLTALFFGIHPIHTEAVTWISSGLDMIGMALLIWSLVFSTAWGKHARPYLALLLATLAYFSLELTVTLPLLLLLFLSTLRRMKREAPSLWSVVPYALCAGIYLFIRWKVINITEVFPYVGDDFFLTMLTMTKSFLVYIQTLLVPVNLTVNHMLAPGIPSFMVEIGDAFPTTMQVLRNQRITDWQTILSLIIMATGGIVAVIASKTKPMVTFALGWFAITLLPFSNIIPGHTLMAERYLYLPSVGWCILLAEVFVWGISAGHTSPHRYLKALPVLAISGFTVLCIALTLQRNAEWKNDFTLWKSAAERNQISYIANVALGKQYLLQRNPDAAIKTYVHVLHTFPEQKAVAGFLVNLYEQEKRYEDAKKLLLSITMLRPHEPEIWVKLGDIYTALSDKKNATNAYRKAASLEPDNPLVQDRLTR